MRKMLYSHLYNYLLIYIQFSIQQGYESHGHVYVFASLWTNGNDLIIIWAFDRGCKKIFQITLNQYYMQKLFMFPIILLFHPNNMDRQNLKIE